MPLTLGKIICLFFQLFNIYLRDLHQAKIKLHLRYLSGIGIKTGSSMLNTKTMIVLVKKTNEMKLDLGTIYHFRIPNLHVCNLWTTLEILELLDGFRMSSILLNLVFFLIISGPKKVGHVEALKCFAFRHYLPQSVTFG